MSFLKKVLSKVGIGSAQVDLILEKEVARMGETICGKLVIQGGEVEQQIEQISIDLRVRSTYRDDEQHTHRLDDSIIQVHTPESLVVEPKEKLEIPLAFEIPACLPLSSIHTQYYFLTNLDIEAGMDAQDQDTILILPDGLLRNFVEGFASLGFQISKESFNGRYQILHFHPTKWLYGRFDEISFQFQPLHATHTVEGTFELDKKNAGLLGSLMDEWDLDERKGHFRFTEEQLKNVESASHTLRSFIEQQMRHLL